MLPRIFIGSSVESLEVAEAIQLQLYHNADVTIWPQGIFDLSGNPLMDLLNHVNNFDFAIFVFNPDDETTIRDSVFKTTRDNVVFEMGLFMSKLGRERVFFIVPDGIAKFHILSDLSGITPGKYRPGSNLDSAVGPFCTQVKRKIAGFVNPHADKEGITNLFGKDVLTGTFHLIFPKLRLFASHNSNGGYESYPYESADKGIARVETPVPLVEVKAMIELSSIISNIGGKLPRIASDVDTQAELDISFCSFGGLTLKTKELLNNGENTFYEFHHIPGASYVRDKQDHTKMYQIDTTHDYAIVAKIHPKLFPNRVYMCVAGMAEWGTSGGSWFLANKWQELEKLYGSKDFGAVIQVKHGINQSAQLIDSKSRT